MLGKTQGDFTGRAGGEEAFLYLHNKRGRSKKRLLTTRCRWKKLSGRSKGPGKEAGRAEARRSPQPSFTHVPREGGVWTALTSRPRAALSSVQAHCQTPFLVSQFQTVPSPKPKGGTQALYPNGLGSKYSEPLLGFLVAFSDF